MTYKYRNSAGDWKFPKKIQHYLPGGYQNTGRPPGYYIRRTPAKIKRSNGSWANHYWKTDEAPIALSFTSLGYGAYYGFINFGAINTTFPGPNTTPMSNRTVNIVNTFRNSSNNALITSAQIQEAHDLNVAEYETESTIVDHGVHYRLAAAYFYAYYGGIGFSMTIDSTFGNMGKGYIRNIKVIGGIFKNKAVLFDTNYDMSGVQFTNGGTNGRSNTWSIAPGNSVVLTQAYNFLYYQGQFTNKDDWPPFINIEIEFDSLPNND